MEALTACAVAALSVVSSLHDIDPSAVLKTSSYYARLVAVRPIGVDWSIPRSNVRRETRGQTTDSARRNAYPDH